MKEIYKTYELIDFLEDKDFVSWVSAKTSEDLERMPELNNSSQLLYKVLEAKNVLSEINSAEIDEKYDGQKLWNRINASTSIEQVQSKKLERLRQTQKTEVIKLRSKSRLNWLVGLTAAASFLIGLFVLLQPDKIMGTTTTTFAEVKTVLLPDGSKVSLNSKSSLSYDVNAWEDDRKTVLKGEAFFEVKKGEKFIVSTINGSVEVLGTSFNVYTRENTLYVECVTGKVRVSSLDKVSEKILTPGENVQFVNGEIKNPTFESRSSWRSNKLSYKAAPLIQIIKDLESKFDVKIALSDRVKATNFTGELPLEDLSESLEAFAWPMKLQYQIKGKEVLLFNE